MTFPGYPPPPPGWGRPPADPGPVPLHPLTVGEVLAVAFGVVRRHLGLLGPLAVAVAAIASAVDLGILAGTGTLADYASAIPIDDVLSGRRTTLPVAMYLATGLSAVVSVGGAMLVAGVATSCAGVDAVGRSGVAGAVGERLRGRWTMLLLTAAVVGVATMVGLVLLIVPGIVVYLVWALAAPAAVMERASLPAALKRSAALTHGRRGRVLGVTLLVSVIAYAVGAIVSAIVSAAVGDVSAVTGLIVASAVGAVVSGVTLSWVGATLAVLYIDARIRDENLGPALRAYAASLPARPAHGA